MDDRPSRRGFLAAAGALALGAVSAPLLAACAASPRAARPAGATLDRIGIQLYTLREAAQRDLAGTLAQLAGIGYREIELAGYYGHSPSAVRALLDRNGLTSPSGHLPYAALGAGWAEALAGAKAVGNTYAVIAWVPPEARRTAADWRRIAGELSRAAEQARAAGLRFAYHNHDFEFVPVEGVVPYDILASQTDPALVELELDLYWATKVGQDPLALFRKYEGRVPMVHVKDATAAPARTMVDVGSGTLDFARLLGAAIAVGGTRHWFVEHDNPTDAFATARNSYAHLSRLTPVAP